MRSAITYALLVAAAAALLCGCNDATDNPTKSESLLAVAKVDPPTACIDIDGTLNGQGQTVYTGVNQEVILESRVRGTSGSSAFNDVIIEEYEIRYEMNPGFPPPNRVQGVSITVPADGLSEATSIATVLPQDIPTYFSATDRGTIVVIFRGHDVGGEPASATGRIPIITATECQ